MNTNNNITTEKLLTTEKMGKLFARYATSGAIGLMFYSLQSIIDGVIVGNFLGADALASVVLMVPAHTLIASLALIIGIGSQAQISISMGKGDYFRTKSAFKSGLYFIVAIAALFTIFINVFPYQVAKSLGANDELIKGSVDYIRGLMPFIIFDACFYFFDYALKSLGHPRISMLVMILSVLLNIALSILFVTVFNMGEFGVGLASGISMLVGCIISGSIVWKQVSSHNKLKNHKGRFNWKTLGRIIYNGSSEGISELAIGFTLFIFNIALMRHAGKEGVAAFAIINYVIYIGTSILLGVSDGAVPVMSYNYGAKLLDRVKVALKIGFRTDFIIGLIFIIILWLFGENVISLFVDKSSPKVTEMAITGARIMCIAFLFNGFNIFTSSFFTAIDCAKWSLVLAGLRGFLLVAIGLYIWPQMFGITGIWITVPIAELITFIFAGNFLRKRLLKIKSSK